MTHIFLDATTCISLGTIGELELLTNFTGTLVVLPIIRNEVTTEPARTNLIRFLEKDDVDTSAPAICDRLEQAMEILEEPTENGDVHLIAAVLTYTADDRPIGIVSDDRRIRTTSRGFGATVTGTIGVIVRAVEEGMCPETAYELVDRIDTHGLHMTGSLRQKSYALIDDATDATQSE